MNTLFAGLRKANLSRDVWLVCISSGLAASSSLGMRNVILSLYVLRLGFGPEWVGTIFATGALCFSLSSLPAGAVGSKLGPRRTMLFGAIASAVAIGLLPLTEVLPESIARLWPAAVQGLSAAGWCFYVVNMVATLAALTDQRERPKAYAVREAVVGAGSFLGALVAGVLPGILAGIFGWGMDTAVPFRHANWASVVMPLVALVPLLMVKRIEPVQRVKGVSSGRFRVTLPLALLVFAAMTNNACFASCKAFSSAYLDQEFRVSAAMNGTVTSIGLGLSVIGALGGGQVARKWGSTRTMATASCCVAASVLVMAIWPNWVAASIGIMGVFGIMGMWRPSFQALQMEIAQPEWRALVSGAGAMGMSMGFSMMSFGGGWIIKEVGYAWIYVLGACFALASATIVTTLGRVMRRRATSS